VPFISEDGRFELTGLPPRRMLAYAVPFDVEKYRPDAEQQVTLDPAQTATIELKVTARDASRRQVLFEDGSPAVVRPAPRLPSELSVAVGTALAGGPPHRSVREALFHTALTSGI
jgi:hypothetical protein